MLAPWKKSYDKPRQHIKKQRHYFANKGPSSQSYGFSSSHVWMWELDYKETWVPKNWCFWTVVLEKTLESPLDCKKIKPVHPKGNQSWIIIGRTDVKVETPILWPPDMKSWLVWKDPDAGKDWGQEEKGTTEDQMFGWHHQLNGHECEQALGGGDGQGSLVCCSPWGCKDCDRTEPLWTELNKNLRTNLVILCCGSGSVKLSIVCSNLINLRCVLWEWVWWKYKRPEWDLISGAHSNIYVRSFLCRFHCNKTTATQELWVFKPGPWSQR